METIVKCLLVGSAVRLVPETCGGDRRNEYKGVVICSILYAILNILIEWAMGIVGLIVTGSGIGAAVAASTASIPATIFNAVFMAVAVSLLYVPVKQIYQKIM